MCFSLTLTLVLIFFYGNGYVENNYIDYKTKGNKMGNYDNLSQTSMSQITIILGDNDIDLSDDDTEEECYE